MLTNSGSVRINKVSLLVEGRATGKVAFYQHRIAIALSICPCHSNKSNLKTHEKRPLIEMSYCFRPI